MSSRSWSAMLCARSNGSCGSLCGWCAACCRSSASSMSASAWFSAANHCWNSCSVGIARATDLVRTRSASSAE
eukprot:1325480-Rhodomonas_salina.1